jgi:hypothetical protein
MKLNIKEREMSTRRPHIKKKTVKEVLSQDMEIKMVIGSWGAYNAANEKALGSKWLTLSDYCDWDEILEELEKQGFDLEGEDEELFIQDTDNLPSIVEYENPQTVFETLYESEVLEDNSKREAFDAYCEVRSWDDFKHLVDSHGSNWDDYVHIWSGFDWDDLGREMFEMYYPELMKYDVIDNYFDFREYGESFKYDTFETFSGGIIEIDY